MSANDYWDLFFAFWGVVVAGAIISGLRGGGF